jgi:hypothetical protein
LCGLRRIALLTCLVALLAAGSAAGQGAAPDLTAAKSVTFEDAVAEDPQGPDITTVTVSNDDTGLVSFRVAIPSRPTLAEGMRFRIWIDSDSNTTTGLAINGMDYYLFHEAGRTSLYRCGGNACTNAARATTLGFSYASGPRFTILDAEIGNAKRFRFAVEAATGIFVDPATKTVDADDARFDDAPTRGSFWTYRLAIGPQRLLVKSLATSPARAGAPFTVRALTTRADTGSALSSGRVRCAARIAARPVEVRSQRFVGRRAVCVFGIPADAAGETIRGSVTVSFGGKKVTRAFSARVRS